jgi:endonuclease G, mitochondrial
LKEPRVVAYELTAAHSHGKGSRAGMSFKVDALAPAEDQGRASDYAGSGYDLGHMAPAEDFAWNERLERDTFSMANVAPQLPGLNRQGWERLEEITRAEACVRGEVYVFTGPIFAASYFEAKTIGADKLPVPVAFFKVVIDTQDHILAFLAPQQDLAKGDAERTEASLVDVEKAAGFHFPLPETTEQMVVPHAPDPDVLERYRAGDCAKAPPSS